MNLYFHVYLLIDAEGGGQRHRYLEELAVAVGGREANVLLGEGDRMDLDA